MFTLLSLGLLVAGSYAVHRWTNGKDQILGLPARTVVGAAGLALMVTPLAPIGLMLASGAIVPAISSALASGDPVGAVKSWASGLLESARLMLPDSLSTSTAE